MEDDCCRPFWIGLVIFLIGFLWYLRDKGIIRFEPFWPLVAMMIGIALVLKSMKPKKKKR